MSFATNANGSSTSRQDYDAWGAVRSGGVSATTLNDTGQRLDSTGLLDYHARLYDPVLARFVSADTIVPGAGALAVWPSDATAAPLFAQGPKDTDGRPTAPHNPQHLNRYAYGTNNPIKYTDPSGHCIGILAGLDTLACATVIAGGAILVGGAAYIAIDTATRYARAHPINWGNYYRSDISDEENEQHTPWHLDPDQKVEKQLPKRGWTPEEIQDVLDNSADTAGTRDERRDPITGEKVDKGPATVYYRPDGHYVVRRDDTGEIIQVSNTNDPEWSDPFGEKVHPR